VPETPTHDARLLLRFGDERQETACELPHRFSISAPPDRRLDLAPARVAFARGEPALPGQAGVVAWVEGTRRGGSARRVVSTAPPAARSRGALAESPAETALLAAPRAPRLDPPAATVPFGRVSPSPQRLFPFQSLRNDPAAPISILLQSRRRNE
jgi:hypothetical protein